MKARRDRPGPRHAGGRRGLAILLAAAALGGEAAGEQREPGGASKEPETISGFVRAADFRSVQGATVRVIGGAEIATVDADGRFTVGSAAARGPGARLEIRLEGYYAADVRLGGGDGTAPPVILVPREWTITTGRYAGEVVRVDLEGATGAACGDCGAFYGQVLGDEDGAAIVAHEIFHALGFGHTCRWRSVVADVKRCRGNQAPAPTASDVAHAQLLWRIREIERGARTSTTVAAALRDYPLESH